MDTHRPTCTHLDDQEGAEDADEHGGGRERQEANGAVRAVALARAQPFAQVLHEFAVHAGTDLIELAEHRVLRDVCPHHAYTA
jgi:hypothetical protein